MPGFAKKYVKGMSTYLGFSKRDRINNNLRIAGLAKELQSQGFEVVVSTICPYKDLRRQVKEITNCRFIYLDGGKEPDEKYVYETPDLY